MKHSSLKLKMTVTGVLVVVLPLILLGSVFLMQGKKMSATVREDLTAAGFHEMEAQLDLILGTIRVSRVLLERDVKKVIEVADEILNNRGGVSMGGEASVEWSAVNQFTKKSSNLALPPITLGDGTSILPERSFDRSVPIVDDVQDRTGDTATIFQRMNEAGDMLRVATNVDNGGVRAVGTYIPAINPDGKPNAVVQQVLSGRDFVGRAFVVNQWYVTVYRPLFDDSGRVTGILYVGSPESAATDSLLDQLADVEIGATGYIYVLNAKGKDRGRYVLSADRKRDGENILELKDDEGNEFIREITQTAVGLAEGEFGSARYPFRNPGDAESRDKVVRYTYFPAWDWVIAVGSYEEEFFAQVENVESTLSSVNLLVLIVCIVAAIVAAVIFALLTGSVVRPIERIIESIQKGSSETTSAANEVSSASQHLAEGSSDQAASLEEAHASMETMNSLVDRNTQVAKNTREETSQSNKDAREGVDSMHSLLHSIEQSSDAVKSMGEVIAEIKESSDAVSRIIKTIDEIAFQTNILALNAAVEAARAGEAGAGFAVVADEVRNLAHRAAEAARETASMIGESVQSSERGVVASDQVSSYLGVVEEGSVNANKLLEGIAESIQRINESMESIEVNSQEQHSGIGQLTELVSHMNEVTQQNAASAEETASASEELNAQALSLQGVVSDLAGIIYGAKEAARRMPTDAGAESTALKLM